MKKLLIIAAVLSGVLVLQTSAGKDKKKQRAYTLPLPEFVGDYFDPMPVPDDNPITEDGVALGRKLFYDKQLSADGSISCGSCHKQEFAFADNKTFSTGVNGQPGVRNSMSLVNLGWGKHFFWDGRAASLEEQVTDPITNKLEMANTWGVVLQRLQGDKQYVRRFEKAFGPGRITSDVVMKALGQFERTLLSFNTRFDQYYFEGNAKALTPQEERGLDIFFGVGNCNHCHSDVLLTDNFFRNNGLDLNPEPGLYNTTGKETDRGRMKVPSLRNVALTAPYMHDGRFKTLEQVIDFYSTALHQKSPNVDEHIVPLGKGLYLNDQQKTDLIAFLYTLTDSSFIRNPAFSDPN